MIGGQGSGDNEGMFPLDTRNIRADQTCGMIPTSSRSSLAMP